MLASHLRVLIDGDNSGAEKAFDETEGFAKKAGASIVDSMIDSAVESGLAFAGMAAQVLSGLDLEAATGKLKAQLGGTAEDAARLGKISGDLYKGAWGDSIDDTNEAIRSVADNIGQVSDMSDADLKAITAAAMDVGKAFDQDVGQVTAAVGQMMKTGMAGSATEAMDIITAGFQGGIDKSGDFLDTLNEYGTQFRTLGIDGKEATGLLQQGLQAGARDADLVADALKEFGIRAKDGSETSAEAFAALGLNAEELTAKIAGGGAGAKEGLDQVLDGLRAMEDPVARNAAAVGLFGTQAEDLGAALFAIDPSSASNALGEVGGAAAKMGDDLNNNAAATIESFKRSFVAGLTEIVGGQVIPALHQLGDWWKANGPAISAAAATIGAAVTPVLSAIADGIVWLATKGGEGIASLIENWDTLAPYFQVALGLLAPIFAALVIHWGALAIAATVSAATQGIAWITATAGAVAGSVAQLGALVATGAKWAWAGAQALFNAGRMAAAWLIALGPIGIAIAAVAGITALVVTNWDTIVAKTTQAWDWVVQKVTGAAQWVKDAWLKYTPLGIIISNWDAIVGFFRGIPDRIRTIFSGAKDWLKDAGKSIITGFVKSLTDAFPGVTKAFQWLTDKIPDWKGPASRDKDLLRPAADLIMGGFQANLESGFRSVQDSLGSFTADLGSTPIVLPAIEAPTVAVGAPAPAALAYGAAGAGTGGGGNTFNFTITVEDARDADATVERFRTVVEDIAGGGTRWHRQVRGTS